MNIELKRNTVTGQPIHSRLGPSGANRWMHCSGSVRVMAAHLLHEEESSEPAAKGTVCHNISAECLMLGKEPWEYAGLHYKEGAFEFEIDEELVLLIEYAVTYVRNLLKKYEHLGAIMYVETQVSSEFDAEAYGTADIRIEIPGVKIIILDFKFGFVRVEVLDEQLRLYGYYSYEMRGKRMTGAGEPKEIELIIVQPRLPNPDDWARSATKTPQELERWFFEEVLAAMERTRDPNALLTMGDHCRWCPVLRDAKCPAWATVVDEVPLSADVKTLTDEQLGEFRRKRKMIEKFLEGVAAEVFVRLRMGKKIPGAKLVDMTGDRLWKTDVIVEVDGKEISKNIKDVLIEQYGQSAMTAPKLKSPAQIEKLTGGQSFTARFAYKPDKGVTVADEEDHRPVKKGLMELADAAQATENDIPI